LSAYFYAYCAIEVGVLVILAVGLGWGLLHVTFNKLISSENVNFISKFIDVAFRLNLP